MKQTLGRALQIEEAGRTIAGKASLPHPQTSLTKMIKYRSRLRVLLITFVAGIFLTNVYARVNADINALATEIPTITVDELRMTLPVVNSDSPLIVRPETDKFTNCCGGGGAGGASGGQRFP